MAILRAMSQKINLQMGMDLLMCYHSVISLFETI